MIHAEYMGTVMRYIVVKELAGIHASVVTIPGTENKELERPLAIEAVVWRAPQSASAISARPCLIVSAVLLVP